MKGLARRQIEYSCAINAKAAGKSPLPPGGQKNVLHAEVKGFTEYRKRGNGNDNSGSK